MRVLQVFRQNEKFILEQKRFEIHASLFQKHILSMNSLKSPHILFVYLNNLYAKHCGLVLWVEGGRPRKWSEPWTSRVKFKTIQCPALRGVLGTGPPWNESTMEKAGGGHLKWPGEGTPGHCSLDHGRSEDRTSNIAQWFQEGQGDLSLPMSVPMCAYALYTCTHPGVRMPVCVCICMHLCVCLPLPESLSLWLHLSFSMSLNFSVSLSRTHT